MLTSPRGRSPQVGGGPLPQHASVPSSLELKDANGSVCAVCPASSLAWSTTCVPVGRPDGGEPTQRPDSRLRLKRSPPAISIHTEVTLPRLTVYSTHHSFALS